MKAILSAMALVFFVSCTSNKTFVKEQVCSPNAISYINASKNRSLNPQKNELLIKQLNQTQHGMQQCYEKFMQRTGVDNLRTCLVVGVDDFGRMEFYNFSSQAAHSDQAFIQCAVKITKRIPYWKFGSNYILLQSYNFY